MPGGEIFDSFPRFFYPPIEWSTSGLARFPHIFVPGVLLLHVGSLGLFAQQQAVSPWPPCAASQVPPAAPVYLPTAQGNGYAPSPVNEAPRLTVERLPPVGPFWAIVPVYPPLANHYAFDVAPSAPAEAEQPDGEPASPKKEESKHEENKKQEGDKKDEPPIEGDPLPRMIETVVIEKAPWYRLNAPWFDPWEGSFEMGLDGSAGNSETFNIRLGAAAKRKTKRHSFLLDLDYHKNTNEAVETANRMYFEGRYERLSEVNPWTWFWQETTDYDEFQPWNVRIVATTGFGYRFLDDEITTLTVRLGSGFSQEVGGPDQDCVPEMHYAFEYGHRMTNRQKMALSVEYFPDITSYGEFRLVNKGDWELLLDDETNLSLKVSVSDRYNYPNPGGELNDLDYGIVLLWSF